MILLVKYLLDVAGADPAS